MQAIMETVFDICYLTTVMVLGLRMVIGAGKNRQRSLFGWMAVVLGFGDAFHLVPRAYALCTTGLEANAAALGVGKFITSITMTLFYVMLYRVWQGRYRAQNTRGLTAGVLLLAVVRIALCLLPQNDWLNYRQPLFWGVLRNIPFAILGGLMIVLFLRSAKGDGALRWMWLAITLSFGFYIPVVLFSGEYPLVGTLMIPKTLAYVWIVWMGYREYGIRPKSTI